MFSKVRFSRKSILIVGVLVLAAAGAFIAFGQQGGRGGFLRARPAPRPGTIPDDLAAFDKLVSETIPAFNKTLTAAGLGPIIANF